MQIESRAGLDNLEAIAAVDGVDALFIGPSDLAASLGYLGEPAHPEVLSAIDEAIARIVKSGKRAGILCTSPALAQRYAAGGASFLALGADVSVLRRAAIDLLNSVRPDASQSGAAY